MKFIQKGQEVEITGVTEFDLERTFECGQCFRWNKDGAGIYIGVAMGKAVRVRHENDSVFITGTAEDFSSIWRVYFDLDRDYDSIRRGLCIDEFMTAAAVFGSGIRILKQDKWEALCSFILSQCNNIPRIKGMVERLCSLFGEQIFYEGKPYYTFPTAEKLSRLTEEALAPVRSGYRAAYILEAARAVADGSLDLDALASGSSEKALETLKKMNGIGSKVASCAVLFGLHMLDSFPVDTWIKKAVAENYGKNFDPSVFSPYAGIAQQYIFYYARSGKKARNKSDGRSSSDNLLIMNTWAGG